MFEAANTHDAGATAIDVALVEDDIPFRESLRLLLDGTPGFVCRGAWGSIEAALREPKRLGESGPDVVLLDIQLPGTSGDEGVEAILERWPKTLVLMLTASTDDEKIFVSLCRGACGYLLKGTTPAQLLEAIEEARAGGSPMSPIIARKVVRLFRKTALPPKSETALTARETDLLAHLADGRSYQQAADGLGVSINTIRNHIRSVYEKLQVHSRSEAVSKALREGLIPLR